MKILLILITTTVLFLSTEIVAQTHSITIRVPNISSNDGTVKFALYQEDNFRITPTKAIESKITDGVAEIIFEDVEAGDYAIICYHDKNDNDKMDFSESGMPLESYGVSNNPASFGPPQYSDAYFVLRDKNISLEIKF